MILHPRQLKALPTSGAPWEYLRAQADAAIAAMNLSPAPDATSPWLADYNGSGKVKRPGTQTLACALVHARTGEVGYRDLVVAACRYLIGTEAESSLDGTAERDKLLATCRQIGAFIVAADLVGMDPNTTGTRKGCESLRWASWLASLRTTPIGSSGQAADMTQLSAARANNWGSFARAARIAIDIYIGDTIDLAAVTDRFRAYCGEIAAKPQWLADADFDSTYSCDRPWQAINSAACGERKDGIIVEDLSRSASGFPGYDATGIGYSFEGLQAALFGAVLLDRAGYDPFAWGDGALRRAMEWLVREGYPQGSGYSTEAHLTWIVNYYCATAYPTAPAQMGRCFGFTDWLYQKLPDPPPVEEDNAAKARKLIRRARKLMARAMEMLGR